MPLTHFHLGSGLFFGTILWSRFFYLPAVLIGSIFPDIELMFVLLYNYKYPYLSYSHHGILHSLLAGFLIAVLMAILLRRSYWPARRWGKKLLKRFYPAQKKTSFNIFLGSLFGYGIHLFFDAIMHDDVFPFWPSHFNPFLRLVSISEEYSIISILGVLGLVLFSLKTINQGLFHK